MKPMLGCLFLLAVPLAAGPPDPATFSVVAADPETGEAGVAVASRFFSVGSVVPFAQADVGAVATQAFANTTYGPRGLALLRRGTTPREAITALIGRDRERAKRQVGIVDARGRAAAWTLHVPMIKALFEQVATPTKLGPLGLVEVLDWTAAALNRVDRPAFFEKFLPLVRRARELGRSMRIGTNHGSLSDRILNRYGDTPLGMVESALEFVRI